MRRLATLSVTLLLLQATPVFADGLIFQLPEDGASVVYKLTMKGEFGGQQRMANGTLSVSSVGTATVDDEACRWIEFGLEMSDGEREQSVVAKILIPESALGKGKTPIDHVKKGWLRQGDSPPLAMDDVKGQMGGPLPVFLSGPVQDAKPLEPAEVETELGKLKCGGTSGSLSFKQGGDDGQAQLQTRLHDKAPFGVAAWNVDLKLSRDGQPRQTIQIDLTMAEAGTGAKSKLPDAN